MERDSKLSFLRKKRQSERDEILEIVHSIKVQGDEHDDDAHTAWQRFKKIIKFTRVEWKRRCGRAGFTFSSFLSPPRSEISATYLLAGLSEKSRESLRGLHSVLYASGN